MSKSIVPYWNPMAFDQQNRWQCVANTGGLVEQLTLAVDEVSGDYTRLTRFKPGADTSKLGSSCHDYPEEVFIVSGRLYDVAFEQWLEAGCYASRPPGEKHGPFWTNVECVVLEISFPSQSVKV